MHLARFGKFWVELVAGVPRRSQPGQKRAVGPVPCQPLRNRDTRSTPMTRRPEPSSSADTDRQPEPMVLQPEWLEHVSGGLNPQPLPPRHEELS